METLSERNICDIADETRKKYELLSDRFELNFNGKPEFFARAPGRVNLIGEHIDYCGYSVLPMAIEHDIVIAASINNDNVLHLTNFDETFPEFKVKINEISIDKTKPRWHDYFLSGFKGILDKFNLTKPKGMNICLLGQVPKSAGLSSSSALVVCSALTTVYANRLSITKTELAETCATAEHYVGTIGGGMDQAISVLAEANSAKLIDFNPLKVTNISLPDGSMFVITNSCVEMNKAATNHFNTRVVECRIASQVLAKSQGIDWRKIKKPLDLQKALKATLLELIDLVKLNLHPEVYTMSEVCDLLETTQEELTLNSLTQNTSSLKQFQLYKRVLHVFTEAQRVYDFKDACSTEPPAAFNTLGKLMNESHESCKDFYDCSCEELDELTDLCRKAGAYGSRLTGAGWGGCAVSLIPQDKLSEFLENLRENYYSKTDRLQSLFASSAFATKPSDGVLIVLP